LAVPAIGYVAVYLLEVVLLVATLVVMATLLRRQAKARHTRTGADPSASHSSQRQWSTP
jgi:uncharacterized membrane protein